MFTSWLTSIAIAVSGSPAKADEPVDAQPRTVLASAKSEPEAKKPDTVTFGDCGAPVAKLVHKLEKLRYLLPRFATECYEGAVSQAVMAMQKHEGLDRDGVFGPQSAEALKKAEPPRAPAGGEPTRVDVDISDQLAYVVTGGELRTVLSVASGAPGYDTPKGRYAIYRKELSSWSRPYKVWMPYASYFNGGIALHENANVYGYAASHGCVRIPPPFAEWVYGVADMGVQVRVMD